MTKPKEFMRYGQSCGNSLDRIRMGQSMIKMAQENEVENLGNSSLCLLSHPYFKHADR